MGSVAKLGVVTAVVSVTRDTMVIGDDNDSDTSEEAEGRQQSSNITTDE